MRKLGRGVLGFLGGFLVASAIALGLCVAAAYAFNITRAEGAYAMGVAFFWMPLGGVIGGIVGAVWAVSGA